MTYGDIAAALGSRAARQVGTILARSGGSGPWWRVIRASGHPAAGLETRALELLRREGTPLRVDGARVDLRSARHRP
jgi:alkylated DNA nucleotide flippase Atl1